MSSTASDTTASRFDPEASGSSPAPRARIPWWQTFPAPALALAILFATFVLVPKVRDNSRLTWTFFGVSAALSLWALILWAGAKRQGRSFRIEAAPPVKSHYIQASMQFCIYAYWGWYWRNVYAEAPLIVSQIVFLYTFDALLSWSRGRAWRLGFGPLPIIFSTNLFLWFKDDWYACQFLLVAVGALGKEYIKWNRDGKRTHIFNPSAFTLAVFSIVLIATGSTDLTWGREIAFTIFRPPHIYLEVFLLGLVVQYFFSVTLMTVSAIAAVWGLNALYAGMGGTYFFIDSSIPAPFFVGAHFLMTDPSTSPRSNVGKVIFGALYGLCYCVLFAAFERMGVPTLYDKLLPLPFLNLSVKLIDRFAKSGIVGRFARWEATFPMRRMNLLHMSCWAAIFVPMLFTGYVGSPQPGASVPFWKKIVAQGGRDGRRGLLSVVKFQADQGSPDACNELGLLYLDGKLVDRSVDKAMDCFRKASALGHLGACTNLVTQFFLMDGMKADEDVELAFDRLEKECGTSADGNCFRLVGLAYETGRGRASDVDKARQLYQLGCARGSMESCKGAVRVQMPR